MEPVQVITLHHSDTVGTACELLREASPGAQVWLVLPWRATWARSVFNLRRLQRVAEQTAIDLRLVSGRVSVRSLAHEAGIVAHASLPWRLHRYRRVHRPAQTELSTRVITAEERLNWLQKRRPRFLGFGALLGTLVAVVLVGATLAAALAALVPGAEIALQPVAQVVSCEFDVLATPRVKDVDYERGHIPARQVQVIVEGRGETPASGSMEVADGHASGYAVFVNRSTSAVTVPKGTIVRAGSGVTARFYTVADITVPGQINGHARVAIMATDPGREGNVGALTINVVEGELATQVEVLNDAPTEGGSVAQAAIIGQEDFGRLQEELRAKLGRQGVEDLSQELVEGEFIAPESVDVQIVSRTFDQVLDQRSDVLSAEMQIVVRAVAIDGAALRQLATRFLEAQGEEGLQIIADSLAVEPGDEMHVDSTEVSFHVKAQGSMAQVIDPDSVRRHVRGKSLEEATSWLQQSFRLQQPPQIALTPEAWERMPLLPARIEVLVTAGEPS